MSEKIKDGFTGGTYPSGKEFELFIPSGDRLGVTGKFNLLVDEVGQISSLNTTIKTSVVNAINELKTGFDGSVKLNTTPQLLSGTYTFGATTGTADKVLFKHDVEFQGNVQFSAGAGDTLAIANTFLALGDENSPSPVGDGGVIIERGFGLQDARIYWDESTDEWKLKPGTGSNFPILHTGITNANGLSYLLTGALTAVNLNLSGYLRTTNSSGSLNGKIWSIANSSVAEDLVIAGVSDNFASAYEAIRILRSGASINGVRFTTTGSTRLTIDTTNVTSTLPIKVNSIVENTTNNGVLIDTLIIKDEEILNNSTRLASFLNTGTLFNPASADLDFTINGNGSQALFIDSGASQIYNRYNTYLDQTLFVNTITQRGSSGVTFNSIANFPSNINVTNTTPTITFNESDQATDTKVWNLRGTSGLFRISAVNDANNSTKPAYSIGKTTNSPAVHDFYIGDEIHLKLTSSKLDVGTSALDANTQSNIVSKSGFNTALYFRQSTSIRGGLEYINSSNSFNLTRYAVSGGGYLGGVLLSESTITIDNLPLLVENSLSVNTINQFSGTLTTLNNNLTVTGNLSTSGNRLLFGNNSSTDRLEFNDTTNEFTFFEDNTITNSTVVSGKTKIVNSSAPLNTKSVLNSINSSGELVVATVSDDGGSTSNIYKNTKNGINTTAQQFYINNSIELTLASNELTFGSGTINSHISQTINANNGYNANLLFSQSGASKGIVWYSDSANTFNIGRYADVGGAYLGGLVLSENNILVTSGYSFDVSNALKVDTINEYTNNNGITIDGVLLKDNSITTSVDVKTNTINERTGGSGVTIDGVLIKDNSVTTITDIKTNDINERTGGSGVTIDGVLLKDGGARFTDPDISSSSGFNFILDDDNNQTGRAFNIYNTSSASSNIKFSLSETGVAKIYNTDGDNILGLIDLADNETEANPYISFNYNTSVGGTVNRIGWVGYGSIGNNHLSITNESTDGKIILKSNDNVEIILDDNANSNADFIIFNSVSTPLFSVNETSGISTHNNDLTLGTGKLVYGANDNITFNDTTNIFSFIADSSVNNSTVQCNTVDTNIITSSNGQVASTWCTFDGDGTPTILDGYNIASITNNGTGDYTLNFDNALPNSNYCVNVSSNLSVGIARVSTPTTTSIRIITLGFNGDQFVADTPSRVYVTIFCKQ